MRTAGREASAYRRWELPNVGPATGPGARLPGGPWSAGQVEALQRAAYEGAMAEGYREGYERGYAEGAARAEAELRASIERLGAIIEYLAAPLAELDREVERALVDLAIAISRQLIRRELKTEPGQIVATVRSALEVLPVAERELRLVLHPDDAQIVRGTLGEEAGRRVVEDASLTRGGCRVECGHSVVDATVEKRLATVVAAVLGGERSGDA